MKASSVCTVYTRSINQPSLAAKVLGQKGNTQYGYLGSLDRLLSKGTYEIIIPL